MRTATIEILEMGTGSCITEGHKPGCRKPEPIEKEYFCSACKSLNVKWMDWACGNCRREFTNNK